MITKEEFENAFKIVNEYSLQLNNAKDKTEKTKIVDWVNLQKLKCIPLQSIHTRLFNILLHNNSGIEFIEDVTDNFLYKARFSGKKVCLLFNQLKNDEKEKN